MGPMEGGVCTLSLFVQLCYGGRVAAESLVTDLVRSKAPLV